MHIENISKKFRKVLAFYPALATYYRSELDLAYYYSLIHPYLSYCNVVWASNYDSRLVRLTLLQKGRPELFWVNYVPCLSNNVT